MSDPADDLARALSGVPALGAPGPISLPGAPVAPSYAGPARARVPLVTPAPAEPAALPSAPAEDAAAAFARELEARSGPTGALSLPGYRPDAAPAAAESPEPMTPAEAALWRAAAAMPALGSGGTVDLPGTPVPAFAAAARPRTSLVTPAEEPAAAGTAPSPAAARRGGVAARGRGPATPPAPPTEEDLNATLIDALTNRPRDAPSLFGEYDSRTESPLDRDLRLADEQRRIEQRRAELAAIAAAEERDRVEAEIGARQQVENERRGATNAARDSYRRAADRAAALSIDPDGFYHSRGVGGTIASAIAIGLGGLSSAVSGGPNVVYSMINDEIERDLAAQQQRIDSAFRRAEAEGTLYDMTRQEYADRNAAMDAARALALENVAAQVAEREASLGSEEARVNAEALAAQLRDAAAASRAEADRSETEWQLRMRLLEARAREREAAAQRAERRAMGGAGGPRYEEPTETRLNAANRLIDTGVAPAAAAASVGIDPALVGGAGRFAEASNADSAGALAALSSALDEIEGLIPSRASGEDAPGVGMTGMLPDFLLSDEGRQMREALLNATALLGSLRSGAAISASEAERFTRILMGAGTDEALRRGIARVRSEIAARTSRVREGRPAAEVEAAAIAGTSARRVVD